MKETDIETVSLEEIEDVATEIHGVAQRCCDMYARGLLQEEERDSRIAAALSGGFNSYLDRKSLRLRIEAEDWPTFASALSRWKEKGGAGNLQCCPWLFYFREDEELGIRYGEEAALPDKIRIMQLLEACRIPVEAFRPVPAGIPCPDEHPGHHPNEYVIGFEIWEQDGGLAGGDFRPGEEITLTDRYGLKTVIRIEEHYTTEAEKDRRHDDADYAGTGTIEGYTTERPRKIRVYISRKNDRIFCLAFFKENDDYALRFPLWEEYRKDRDEIRKIHEKIIRDLVDEYTPGR